MKKTLIFIYLTLRHILSYKKGNFLQLMKNLFFIFINFFRVVEIKLNEDKNTCNSIQSIKNFVWLFYRTRHSTFDTFSINKKKKDEIKKNLGLLINPINNITGNLLLKSPNYKECLMQLKKNFKNNLSNDRNIFIDYFYFRYIGFKLGVTPAKNYIINKNENLVSYTNSYIKSNRLPLYTVGVFGCVVIIVISKKYYYLFHLKNFNLLKKNKRFNKSIKKNKSFLFCVRKPYRGKCNEPNKDLKKNFSNIFYLKKNHRYAFKLLRQNNKINVFISKTKCKFKYAEYEGIILNMIRDNSFRKFELN